MKLTYIVVISAFVAGECAQAQTPPVSPGEKAVARACKADAKLMCGGKTGQEERACLRGNSEKLSSDCKNALSKLPKPQS